MPLRKLKLNNYKIIFFSLIGLIFIQALFFFPKTLELSEKNPGLSKEQLVSLATKGKKKSVEQLMRGIHLFENSHQSKGWELKAEEANGSTDDQWILKKVRIEFFNDNKSSYIVTGDVGEVDGKTKNMIFRGRVVTQSSNGYQFVTNDLFYLAAQKQLKSDDVVNMLGPDDRNGQGFRLTGDGFYIDIQSNLMNIVSHVEAQKNVDSKLFQIKSRSAQFSNKNQEARFTGDVKVHFDTSVMTAPTAFLKYSEKMNKIESIQLEDQVTLKDIDKTATCKLLVINLMKDIVTMSGNPKVNMGEDEIQGDEIVFTEQGQKIKINKVKIDSKKLLK